MNTSVTSRETLAGASQIDLLPTPVTDEEEDMAICYGNDSSSSNNHPQELIPVVHSSSTHSQITALVKKPKKRRNNSARAKRYRQRKKDYELQITTTVEALRQQIRELNAARQVYHDYAFSNPFTTAGSAMQFVREYADIFRFGLNPHRRKNGVIVCPAMQRAYLTSLSHPKLCVFGEWIGVDALMEQWRRYTDVHEALEMKFLSATFATVDNCVRIHMKGVTHLLYSHRTVEQVFPHILPRMDIVQRLMGTVIHLPFVVHLHFNEIGQLIRYDLFSDFVAALQEALNDLEAVSLVLNQAQILETTPSALDGTDIDEDDDGVSQSDENWARQDDLQESLPALPQQSSCAMDLKFILS